MGFFDSMLYRQWFISIPYPTQSVAGKTVIVTGSNVGLGKEAARHFVRLGASTVIIAVRNTNAGEEVKQSIEQTTGCGKAVVKVWHLDLASYQSVKDFAAKAERELNRLDILLENAALATPRFQIAEDNERMITVNVISTFLLAFLLMPKLKDTAHKFNTRPNLTIVTSETHFWTDFPEEKGAPEGQILKTLAQKEGADMALRYSLSKLLEVLMVREMAERRPVDRFPITVNCINPGLCHSELARELGWGLWLTKQLLARSTECGSRTLVDAGTKGPESHGAYLSDCRVTDPSPYVRTKEGNKAQKRVWDELMAKLEEIQPGVTRNF